jgi:hypothetical protein
MPEFGKLLPKFENSRKSLTVSRKSLRILKTNSGIPKKFLDFQN